MPRNGSGVYSPPGADYPVVSGTVIQSATFNDLISDISTAMSASIASDGQTTVTADIPLNSHKITGLGLGSANTDAARVDNAYALALMEFRMTLTSATPVTTSDVTAATTVYVTPYKGKGIALYDGSNWHRRTSAEMSIAVPATTSTMYDLFCYDNSGTPTLEVLAWTNDTTRATALVLQDGVLSKSGAVTRRYLGSFRTTTVSGQTEDSLAKRYVWNYYNRDRRLMQVLEATVTWNYSTGTIRQANGSASNQLDFIIGYSEDIVSATIQAMVRNSTSAASHAVGVGLDTTTAFSTPQVFTTAISWLTGQYATTGAFWRGYPGVGRHYLAWNELPIGGVATATWGGALSAGVQQSGIFGELWG